MMPVPIASEELNPFAARIIGVLWARVEEAGDDRFKLEDSLMSLWWGVQGLEKIAIAIRGGRDIADVSCLHFSLACSNEVRRVANIILDKLDVDPFTSPGWRDA